MSIFKYDYQPRESISPQHIVLTPGLATFKIIGVNDKAKNGLTLVSKSGLDMLRLDLLVTDSEGKSGIIYDYITSKTPWKIVQISDSIRCPGLYNESGQLNYPELIGKKGDCSIKTDFATPPHKDKSVIEKYLAYGSLSQPSNNNQFHPVIDNGDDDLPF